MRAYRFPQADPVHEATVSRFGGVDFETHPAKVDLSHSPDMKNMLAGETHFLVKRPGYRRVCKLGAPVYGLFALPGSGEGALLHCGTSFYRLSPDGTAVKLRDGAAAAFPPRSSWAGGCSCSTARPIGRCGRARAAGRSPR